MKILVADDEKSIGESYKLALEAHGHEVTLTHDGVECIQSYREQGNSPHRIPFDVVIIDYRMPKKNGIETVPELLSMFPYQPIIIVTAYAHELVELTAMKRGGKSMQVIQKPIELEPFVILVEATKTSVDLDRLVMYG